VGPRPLLAEERRRGPGDPERDLRVARAAQARRDAARGAGEAQALERDDGGLGGLARREAGRDVAGRERGRGGRRRELRGRAADVVEPPRLREVAGGERPPRAVDEEPRGPRRVARGNAADARVRRGAELVVADDEEDARAADAVA
jgi:hypothetical protein